MNKMKKTEKIILTAAAAVAVTVIAAAVFFYLRSRKKEVILPVKYSLSTYWINSRGVFQYDDVLLTFYDPSNGEKYTACNKSGCTHNDKSCPAYNENIITGATFTDDGLIYLEKSGDDAFSVSLYKVGMDGKNKTCLHTFREMMEIVDVCYADDGVYVCYRNSIDKNGNKLDKTETGIIYYDIRRAKEEKVTALNENGPGIVKISVNKGTVFFICNYSDLTYKETKKHRKDQEYIKEHEHLELMRCGNKGKNTDISGDIAYTYSIPVFHDQIIYADSNATYTYDTNKGESRKIADESCEAVEGTGIDEFLLIRRSKSGKFSYYRVNRNVDRLESIRCSRYCIAYTDDYAYFLDNEGNLLYETRQDFISEKEHFRKFG